MRRPITDPNEYMKRGKKILETIDRWKKIWTRISRSSEFKNEDRDEFRTRKEWIDDRIIRLWTRYHFTDDEEFWRERKAKTIPLYDEAFEILDQIIEGKWT